MAAPLTLTTTSFDIVILQAPNRIHLLGFYDAREQGITIHHESGADHQNGIRERYLVHNEKRYEILTWSLMAAIPTITISLDEFAQMLIDGIAIQEVNIDVEFFKSSEAFKNVIAEDPLIEKRAHFGLIREGQVLIGLMVKHGLTEKIPQVKTPCTTEDFITAYREVLSTVPHADLLSHIVELERQIQRLKVGLVRQGKFDVLNQQKEEERTIERNAKDAPENAK